MTFWRTKLWLLLLPVIRAKLDCTRQEYERCVGMADPLIKEPHLVFPDNMNDIDLVCRTWNRFVDCLKTYTDNCFTEQQKRQFNKAVENPIESVHQMCMQPNYQKEYLRYAPCIKNTIIQRDHCGHQYNLLVDQVSQGDIISKSTLCCSHDRFKQCIERETRRLCDRNLINGPATHFASQTIDKALSFLQDQCFNYIPNSGDCLHNTPYQYITDPLTMTSSEPWNTREMAAAKEDVFPVTAPATTQWLPSSTLEINRNVEQLGSRTRPASYGRASSWSSSSTSSPSTSSTTRWSSTVSWQPSIITSTETWYPAAGNQLNNEVDEPNQQGLFKAKNGTSTRNRTFLLFLVLGLFLCI